MLRLIGDLHPSHSKITHTKIINLFFLIRSVFLTILSRVNVVATHVENFCPKIAVFSQF